MVKEMIAVYVRWLVKGIDDPKEHITDLMESSKVILDSPLSLRGKSRGEAGGGSGRGEGERVIVIKVESDLNFDDEPKLAKKVRRMFNQEGIPMPPENHSYTLWGIFENGQLNTLLCFGDKIQLVMQHGKLTKSPMERMK